MRGARKFAFLAFLLGQSLEGFAQWKELLRLVLECERAPLSTRTTMYVRLLATLRAQLQHCLAAGDRCSLTRFTFP
jgi:A1 cistron-splicing factor AAR2